MTKNFITITIFAFFIGFLILCFIQAMDKPYPEPTKTSRVLTRHEIDSLKKLYPKQMEKLLLEIEAEKLALQCNFITLHDGLHSLWSEIRKLQTTIDIIKDSGELSSEYQTGKLEYLQFELIYLTRIAKTWAKAISYGVDLSEEINEQDMLRKRNLINFEQGRYKK